MFKDIFCETERLILKPYCMDDIDDLFRVYSDEKVMRYIPEGVYSYQRVVDLVEWMVNHCYEKNTPEHIEKFGVSIMLKENKRVIGWCGIGSYDCNPSDYELFYGLASDYWGRGLGTEAAGAMLNYGFTTIGLPRIMAVVNSDNMQSKKILEKLGMKFEKTVVEVTPQLSGYEGELYYSIKKDEYTPYSIV